MSEQLPPPSPDPVDPTTVQPVPVEPAPVDPVAPPAAVEPPVYQPPVEPAAYQAPPAYPPAPAYPDAGAGTWPAAYPAAPPPAYPAAGYPGAAAPATTTSSNAIVALILAVISWAVCPIIPAIVALVLAANASKEIAASGGRIEGQGLVTAAKVVSWVNIGLWAAILVVGVFFLVLVAVAGGMGDPAPI